MSVNIIMMNKIKTCKTRKMRGGMEPSPFSNINTASEISTKTGGRGILTDIAVPAVLLYANNTIGKNKSRKSNKPRKSRKRKTRFSRRIK